MNNDEPKKPAPTIDEIRIAKQAATMKIAAAVREAASAFAQETGLAINGVNVNIREVVTVSDGRRSHYPFGGVEIEVERI